MPRDPAAGEQLDLLAASHPPPAADPPRPRGRHVDPRPGAAGLSNDMALAHRVLTLAAGPGYLLEATTAPDADQDRSPVWRGGEGTDAAGAALLDPTEPDEAAMVTQLLERGWLHRSARPEKRTAIRRGEPSGRRRTRIEAHPVTLPAASAHALARWSALAAVPAPRPGPPPA